MRLSVYENRPEEYIGAKIYLNGKLIDRVVTADEEAGKVWRVHDPVIVSRDKETVFKYMQAGAVRIEIHNGQ